MKRKLIVFVIILELIIPALAGCRLNKTTIGEKSTPEYGYNIVSNDLPSEISVANSQCTDGESIYIAGMSGGGLPRLYKISESGDLKKIKLPGTIEYIFGICFDNELYVLCGDYPKTWKDAQGIQRVNQKDNTSIKLITYSADGKILNETKLSGKSFEEGLRLSSLEFVDGKFYTCCNNKLICFDTNGQEIDCITFDNSQFLAMCRLDKNLVVSKFNFDTDCFGCEISIIDTKSKISVRNIYNSPDSIISGLGVSKDGSLLISNEKGIFSLDHETGNLELFAMWSEMGALLPEYESIVPYKDGYLACTSGQKSIDVICYGEIGDTRQRLVLLTDSVSPGMKQLVDRFNSNNKEYYVVVELFDHNEDGASERLRAEIISGTGPDIFSLYNDSELDSLSGEKVYEDLYVYLDSDEEFSRESIFPSLLKAMEYNGNLYSLPYDFMIYTFFTTSDIDYEYKMVLSDYAEIAKEKNIPLFSSWATRNNVWDWIKMCCAGSFIDEDNYTCSFNSEAFISLLETCGTISQNTDISNDDVCLLMLDQVSTFVHIGTLGELYGTNYFFTGCPNGANNGNCFQIGTRYSISAQSKNKDGAWQFVREVMSSNNDIYSYQLLPASTYVFETMVDIAKGEGLIYPNYLKNPVKIKEYDEQQVCKLINNTTFLDNKYPEVQQILDEEAIKFFNGNRSASDTAEMIQSRVSIFLSERFG